MSIDAEMTRVKIPIKSGLMNGYFFTIFLNFFKGELQIPHGYYYIVCVIFVVHALGEGGAFLVSARSYRPEIKYSFSLARL